MTTNKPMNTLNDNRIISLLKDDIYQLIEIRHDPYERIVLHQGTLPEIEAWLALEERGLL